MSKRMEELKKHKKTYQEHLHSANNELEKLNNICKKCDRFDCEDCYERRRKETLRMGTEAASSRLKYTKKQIRELKKKG